MITGMRRANADRRGSVQPRRVLLDVPAQQIQSQQVQPQQDLAKPGDGNAVATESSAAQDHFPAQLGDTQVQPPAFTLVAPQGSVVAKIKSLLGPTLPVLLLPLLLARPGLDLTTGQTTAQSEARVALGAQHQVLSILISQKYLD